jgi:NADH-quinone oxidoreductase subunit M
MNDLHLPWLELSILLPLVGALFLFRLRDSQLARRWCLALAGITLFFTVGAWQDFNRLHAALAHDPGPLGHSLHDFLELDALSAPLMPLTALLYLLTALATLRTKIRRFSFAWTLVSLGLTLAILACRNPWGIITLLTLQSVPPLLELRARHKPTRIYILHTAAFLACLALGWAAVEWEGRQHTHTLLAVVPLLLAVLIRTGSIPFHCWITDLFEHATFGTALLHVTPMLGAYAAVRMLLPIAPDWVLHSLALVSLATAVYAAGMALVQREARRFFCYIFLSHAALVLVGLESLSPIALTGALCVWLSVGLALAGFGLSLRALEARHGRLSLVGYHGVYEHTPLLAVCFLLTGLASVGFPGTFGFVGTELLVDGAVHSFPLIGVAVVVAAALNGIAVMQAYFKLFTGTRYVSTVPLAIGMRERIAVLTLALLILGGGLYPQPGVQSRHHAALEILQQRIHAEPNLKQPQHADITNPLRSVPIFHWLNILNRS